MKAVLLQMAPGVPVIDLFADAPVGSPKASAYLDTAATWAGDAAIRLRKRSEVRIWPGRIGRNAAPNA